MATALGLYNAALRELGEEKLATVSDDVTAQYVITDVYSDVLADCLQAGLWRFSLRAVKLDADTAITPTFGPSEVFAKPSDFVRLAGMATDEDFNHSLTNYITEGTNWLSYTTPIYVRYVSNGSSYGLALTAWPRSFTRYVELSLALRICERVTQNATKHELLEKATMKAFFIARSRDAMDDAQPQKRDFGSWNAARGGFGGGQRRDNGPYQV